MGRSIADYRQCLRDDPRSFVEGVASFCKQAQARERGDSPFRRVLPWLLGLAGIYGAMKFGSGWGRYAEKTDNPNGPVKGPIAKLLELSLPEGNRVVWPGQKAYGDVMSYRTAQDDAKWNAEFGNSVADGRAKSLTTRTRG